MTTKLVKIQCRGRRPNGRAALKTPIPVTVRISKCPDSGHISVDPERCPYNTGGHGQRCKASHPDQDKVGDGIGCPYAFDYPYVLKAHPHWKPPYVIGKAFRKMTKMI